MTTQMTSAQLADANREELRKEWWRQYIVATIRSMVSYSNPQEWNEAIIRGAATEVLKTLDAINNGSMPTLGWEGYFATQTETEHNRSCF